MRGWVAAAGVAVAVLVGVGLAGSRVPNRAYVQSGPGGAFFARATPDGPRGSAGETRVYGVGARGKPDTLIHTYPWFSPDGVYLAWSPIGGLAAITPSREPLDRTRRRESGRRVELSLYLDGKTVREFTADELKALGAKAGPFTSAEVEYKSVDIEVVGDGQVPGTNDYEWVVRQDGGPDLRLDVVTGEPRVLARRDPAGLIREYLGALPGAIPGVPAALAGFSTNEPGVYGHGKTRSVVTMRGCPVDRLPEVINEWYAVGTHAGRPVVYVGGPDEREVEGNTSYERWSVTAYAPVGGGLGVVTVRGRAAHSELRRVARQALDGWRGVVEPK